MCLWTRNRRGYYYFPTLAEFSCGTRTILDGNTYSYACVCVCALENESTNLSRQGKCAAELSPRRPGEMDRVSLFSGVVDLSDHPKYIAREGTRGVCAVERGAARLQLVDESASERKKKQKSNIAKDRKSDGDDETIGIQKNLSPVHLLWCITPGRCTSPFSGLLSSTEQRARAPHTKAHLSLSERKI